MTIENVEKVIKHFNHQGEQSQSDGSNPRMDIRMTEAKNKNKMSYEGNLDMEMGGPIEKRISNLIINDLTIQPYSEAKQASLVLEFSEQQNIYSTRVIVQAYGLDASGNLSIESNQPCKSEIVVSLDMTIKELKSLILSYHGSKPFFLDYLIDNSRLVRDLLKII